MTLPSKWSRRLWLLLTLLGSVGGRKLDIDKVDLEFPVGLDTDEQGRTSTSSDNLVGEVLRLENESEGTFLRVVAFERSELALSPIFPLEWSVRTNSLITALIRSVKFNLLLGCES